MCLVIGKCVMLLGTATFCSVQTAELMISVLYYSRNGYSLYCAELMVNMKDVPSTERMVLCSKQWKMMTQKEKDMFQKRCEQVTLSVCIVR